MKRQYKCPECGCETNESQCPICGERTVAQLSIYWDKIENIPFISFTENNNSDLVEIGKDIRPVFPQERLLIECILDDVKPLDFIESSCWRLPSGIYIIDGKKVKFVIKDLIKLDSDKIREEYKQFEEKNTDVYFNQYIEKFINLNKERFNAIDDEALTYVASKTQDIELSSMFVSFSGGKDSTVVSDIVRRGIGNPKITHIFGDTTLEFPETYEYIKRFKQNNRMTPMVNAKNREKDFFDLAEIIGPPSRVMRWCCTVFKTGAIARYLESLYKSKPRIFAFHGIRRAESLSRSKYDRESDSPKITKQRVISPIIDWLDIDVWLYIFTRKIDFNEAYKLGFSRVGCWCCPNNSQWSEFLSKIFHPEQFYPWRELLIRNAVNIGKLDPEDYVDSGVWKAKQGGDGISYAKKQIVSFKPCATDENSFNYELSKPIDDNLYEMFKPLGKLNFDLGNYRLNEVCVLDNNNNIIIRLQGKKGQNGLKVSITNLPIAGAKNINDAKKKIECQITKFQMCLNCSACMSVCRFDAIKIKLKG